MGNKVILLFFITCTTFATFAQKKHLSEAKPFFHSRSEVKSDLLFNYDVNFYHLNLEADNQSDAIKGNVLIKTTVRKDDFTKFGIELVNSLTVDSVFLNQKKVNYQHQDSLITVNLDSPLNTGDKLDARVYYHGQTGSGMRKQTSSTWNKEVNYTLSESFHAKDWFPCKEVLTDKADSAYIYVTTNEELKVGSNGVLKGVDLLEDGKARYRWETTHPINYYLISVSIGDFLEYSFYKTSEEDPSDSLLIQNFLYDDQECLNQYRRIIDQTDDFIALLNEKYGPYPFKDEKYGHCMAPFGGGMEHQTMTTMGGFNFGITIHELGHQWFGDYVTCATWQDIWINEGFATYTEYLGEEFLHNQQSADEWMKDAHKYVFSEQGGSVYIPEEEKENESRIFNYRLSYKKGAAIVHQIRFELNDDSVFFKTLRNFLNKYADSAATGEDFRKVLENTSGRDFTEFFKQWYYGEGYPIINVDWEKKESSDSLRIIVSQESSMPDATPFFKMHTEYLIEHSNGDTVIRTYQKQPEDTFCVYMPEKVNSIQVDPNNWVINKTGTVQTSSEKEKAPENNTSHWKVYPIPAGDKIHIESLPDFSNEKVTIHFYTVQGKKVKSLKSTANKIITVDCSDLNTGLYYIKLLSNGTKATKKILIE